MAGDLNDGKDKNRRVAREEVLKLVDRYIQEEDRLVQKLKDEGKWIDGLDSNDRYFSSLHEQEDLETKNILQKYGLKSLVL